MSVWSMRNPEGGPPSHVMPSLDPDDERAGPPYDQVPCPTCGRPSVMIAAYGKCPYGDCRHGSTT